MKMWKLVAALLLVAGWGALPTLAQDAKKPLGPPLSVSQEILEQWNDIGRKLIAMAEDFPEDKYNYKPMKDSRTFAEMMLHVAGSMYYFTDIAEGKKPRYADDIKDENLKTKAQIVAFVKQCVADGAAEIQKLGDAGMTKVVQDGAPHLDHLSNFAYGMIEHSGEHYGALVVYYRNNGLVPPESRPQK
jgi:uncharacterized damage-inducible protein DinB